MARHNLFKMPVSLAVVASCLLCASTWAQQPTAAQTPATPPPAGTETAVNAPAPAGTAMPETPPENKVSPNYLIGPGDTLQIFVWRNPELTTTVPVRPDGKISTPLVEDMVAVSKTPSQLARDIERVLGEFIRSPQVNVIVSVPQSVFSQVKVIGQVSHPQSLAYRDGMRVLDAVLAAGGLTEFAAGNRARVVRKENGKEVSLKVKIDDLLNKGSMQYNLELKPGDVLVVPESRL